jgi:hypothetical protein
VHDDVVSHAGFGASSDESAQAPEAAVVQRLRAEPGRSDKPYAKPILGGQRGK